MNRIAEKLDAKLKVLDPDKAKTLIRLVQNAIKQIDKSGSDWPKSYFADTAGSFAGEPLERSPQGEPSKREDW